MPRSRAAVPARATRLAQAQFVAEFVHELRTSLTIISLVSHRLEGPDQPQVQELQAELGQISRLINAVSQLAQLDDLTMVQSEPVNLARLARQELERVLPLAQQKGQAWRWAGPDPLLVWGDEEQLSWLLYQLLDNALEYTPEGGQIKCERCADSRLEQRHGLVAIAERIRPSRCAGF